MTYVANDKFISDTAEIVEGRFLITGKILEPTQATIRDRIDSELAWIYLEPGKMRISINKDVPFGYVMTGSKTQAEYEILKKMEQPVYDRLLMLKEQGININDRIKNSKEDSDKIALQEKAKEIDSLWSDTRKELDPIEIKFVLENPKSFVTPQYLNRMVSREVISLDSAKSIFNGLDNSLRESRYGKFIVEDIRKKENVSLGAQAPDFKATDLTQQTVILSQFKGKSIVLLDFWASWCVPCRESMPHIRSIYRKYHSKGLEVIAISVDENRKSWIEAVKQDSLEIWYNILVAEKWPVGPYTNDDIFQNYYYTAIPEQILIDKNGKIIFRHTGYSKESEESLDRQLSLLFEN
jgi:peroxiredoxin